MLSSRIRGAARAIYLAAFAITLCACDSVLYYPTREIHVDPSKYGLVPKDIYFESEEDGKKLHGWYFKSRITDHPKALLLFFHGNAQNISSHYQSLVWLLDHPYDFFIFDYQGYGKSEGTPTPKGTVLDGRAAMKLIQKRNPDLPLVFFGQSLGTAIGMKALIELKEEVPFKLAVVESPLHSYVEVARFKLDKANMLWLLQYFIPSDEFAPKEDVAKISPIPMIVIHGNKDPVVDYTIGQKVFEIAREPKEFWHVEEGEHIQAFTKFGEIFRPKLLEKLAALQ